MKKFLRDIWSASRFDTEAVAFHAKDAMREEAKQGVYAMALLTLFMMAALAGFHVYLGLGTQHLYTFALLGVLAGHVAASARKLSDTADLKVLYLLGMVLLSLTALAFVLIAQREGGFSGPTRSAVVLLFMVVPLVPWGMREALIALATIYSILTGSALSAGARFDARDLLTLQFLMLGAALIAMAVVARTVLVRKGHLEARFDLSQANQQLTTIAMHDPLTGVKNRRFLEERFEGIAAEFTAGGGSFYFCVLDIDRFKHLNDTFGHACGDRVLQRLASALTEAFAHDDHVVRMGGDEFVILTRNADVSARFARALETFNDRDGGETAALPRTSVSLGAARVDGAPAPQFDPLYLVADKALYKAKAQGAGSVVETEFGASQVEEAA